MPLFETTDQLASYVKNVTIKEVETIVSIVGKEKLNMEVEDKVYGDIFVGSSLQDDFYQNTFGLRESAKVEATPFGNGVFDDGLLLSFYLEPKNKYTSYYPIGANSDFTDMIVKALDQGHTGFYKGLSVRYQAKNFFKSAFRSLTKGGELKKRVTDYMRRLGYVISRSSTD